MPGSFDSPRPFSSIWYQRHLETLGETACRQLGIYEIPDSLLLTVVVPVFNEQETLEELVTRVAEVPIRKEILLIDDGSEDNSYAIAESLNENYLEDPLNTIRIKRLAHEPGQGKRNYRRLLDSGGRYCRDPGCRSGVRPTRVPSLDSSHCGGQSGCCLRESVSR